MKHPGEKKTPVEIILSAPSLSWLVLFMVVPALVVLAFSFRSADPYGGIGPGWTLDSIMSLCNPSYPDIIWRTLWISVSTTVICLLLGIPTGYYMARSSRRRQEILLMLIVVPFWINFLIRIYAWKVLLHPEGPLKNLLVLMGCISPDSILLYHPATVVLVSVYTYLPFAILPIYAAAEKFDFSLVEAAYDLGADHLTAFYRVFMPGISQGMVTATLMVLIPTLGSYVIPELVGGVNSEMIGNKIAQRTFVDRNLPHASALAMFLTLAVILPITIKLVFFRNRAIDSGKGVRF